jgi:hypothetical protein
MNIYLANVRIPDTDSALLRVEEAAQQGGQRAFSVSATAGQRIFFAVPERVEKNNEFSQKEKSELRIFAKKTIPGKSRRKSIEVDNTLLKNTCKW